MGDDGPSVWETSTRVETVSRLSAAKADSGDLHVEWRIFAVGDVVKGLVRSTSTSVEIELPARSRFVGNR